MQSFTPLRRLTATLLSAACLSAGMSLGMPSALADDNYPSRPIRMVVGFAPGGPTDVIARVVAKDLTQSLGQSVLVENRPGANSQIAIEQTARAAPDGYTLLLFTLAHHVNAILAPERIRYDPFKDFTPITLLSTLPMIAVTAWDSPFRSLTDVVEAARKDAGAINYGSAGNGGSAHLAAAQLAAASRTTMTHVPFKGNGPALSEVMAGRVHFMFYPTIGVADLEAQKRLRPLAITTKRRHPDFPAVQTTDEAGFTGFDEYSPGVGVLAPSGTPKAIVDKLHAAIRQSLANPATADQLRRLGAVVSGADPEAFGRWLREDHARWERVIQAADIRSE